MVRARFVLAAALVLLSLVLYVSAAWSYLARIGVVYGRFEPGGFKSSFSVDVGVVYAGGYKTVNASVEAVIPEDTTMVFWGRPSTYYIINSSSMESMELEPREPGKEAATVGFNYTVLVFMDGDYLGSFSQDKNLTASIPRGEHLFTFIVTVYAPPRLDNTTSFTLEIWVSTR